MEALKIPVACMLLGCWGLLGSSALNEVVKEPLTLIGSTKTKNLFISNESISSLVVDFASALHYACKLNFGMELVAIETQEEYDIIDKWFTTRFDNTSSGRMFWTSAVGFGKLPFSWASSGTTFKLPRASFSIPWPGGAEASPSYSWNRCFSIYKHCNRPKGYPEGCWPIRTEFHYADCRQAYSIICEERIKT